MDAADNEQIADFRSLLEELRKQLLDACVHFDNWEQLWPTEEVVGVINQYKGFFSPTRNAHLSQFFIKVCNVLSNDPKSPSLYRVLSIIGRNPELAPDINAREVKGRLRKHKNVLEGIKQYRDTKAAHWDTSILDTQKPVLFGESREMLKELQDIFNEICKSHTGNQLWSFKPLEHDDASRLLRALKIRNK
jgi:hypothetical protein